MGGLSVLLLALAAQVSVAKLDRRAADPAGWWRGDVFYEVFVRSFADSNGDGHGDLRGLTARLDTLAELGVTGLYLMPILPGPTDHGYAAVAFDQVEPRYGTMDDALALFDAAHRRGIAVVLDYVPNHVSIEHPWFVQAAGGDRIALDHFVTDTSEPAGWTVPWNEDDPRKVWTHNASIGRWYYHAFDASMPDLNLSDRPTRATVLRAAEEWIARGADGLRIDGVRYLTEDGAKAQAERPGTFAFLAELRGQLAATGALLVGEAWADTAIAARYLGDGADGVHLVFDFDRAGALDEALSGEKAAPIEAAVARAERASPPGAGFAPILTNHDHAAPRASKNGRDAAALANALLVLSGGVPFFWQGDEIAARAIDEQQTRRPMRWTADAERAGFTTGTPWREIGSRASGDSVEEQRADRTSVWSRTKEVLAIRRKSAALSTGARAPIAARGSPSIWAFLRHDGSDRVLVVANLASSRARATLDLGAVPQLKGVSRMAPLYGAEAPIDLARKKKVEIALGPRSFALFAADRDQRRFNVRFASGALPLPPADAIDQGYEHEARRGIGFSTEHTRRLRCSSQRGKTACSAPFDVPRAGPVRWVATLPPGAYSIGVDLAAPPAGAGAGLLAEGLPLASRKKDKALEATVFVRDGLLSIVAAGGSRSGADPIWVEAIRVAPAKTRTARIEIERHADRLVLRSRDPGTVEWRMDRSSSEPAEAAELVKDGSGWAATLGPWRKGAVREIGFVVRSTDGAFLTGPSGGEIVAAIE